MRSPILTRSPSLATINAVKGIAMTGKEFTWRRLLPLVGVTMALAGCISVKAPDKPIVNELNINIKQEVVYRLAGDASQTIDKNKDIF